MKEKKKRNRKRGGLEEGKTEKERKNEGKKGRKE